jgi:hypothetical protein
MDLTGKKDAIFIKEEYQKALDHVHEEVKSKVKWLQGMNHKLKDNQAAIQKYKQHIKADEEEREELYRSLTNLLMTELEHEGKMFKELKKRSSKTKTIIKPKIKDSDVEEFKINSSEEFQNNYPKYASKSSFKNILCNISEIENGIKQTKKKYNRAVSEVMRELSYWPKNIMQAEDLIKRFKEQLKEAKHKLTNMRYLNSIFYKLSSEKEKQKVNLHTLYYRMEELENTVKKLKEEVTSAEKEFNKINF